MAWLGLLGELFYSSSDCTMLVTKAKAGDLVAARELLDRCLGKPSTAVTIELPAESTHATLTLNERRARLDRIAQRLGVELEETPVQSLPAIAVEAGDSQME